VKIRFLEIAQIELDGTIEYYNSESPGLGDSFLLETLNTIERIRHFFVERDGMLIEVVGTTIHPTNDTLRETPPQGYFFVGKLWNEDYISEIMKITDSNISLLPAQEIKESPINKKKGEIHG